MSCKSFWQSFLKIPRFALISDMNLLLWYIGGIKGIFYHSMFLEGTKIS